MIMDEFKNILLELGTNDWGKRIRVVDQLTDFVRNQQSVIKNA